MESTEDVALTGDVPARRYRPACAQHDAPVLVYCHGGGWILLGIETHDRLVRELADAAGAPAIRLDWPLAPESVFPGTLETCVKAVRDL